MSLLNNYLTKFNSLNKLPCGSVLGSKEYLYVCGANTDECLCWCSVTISSVKVLHSKGYFSNPQLCHDICDIDRQRYENCDYVS